ncbi:hypothetical protein AZI85_05290 [Bdellovibrio bacteriovorus]|uniref:DUF3011 domain-containing protein n=1 Tax=Bdellovibrio bacteriovorus TaxID=959 RepID=A0A150WJ28_BDEBC|nr:DUF3011 domain-containing protein [Bdellovibrio bacteriovorus]KYG63445.1 hypothetical protein AZI85_05290 [Bdellovibrio bacteriovorus]
MKHLFAALLLMCSSAPAAHADVMDSEYQAETSYIRPGPRPPGRPAPYPDPVRPGPRPPHNPGYPPYPNPPPSYRYEYVTCSSYGYRYQECYFNSYGVSQIRLYSQHSYDACIWGRTAGAYGDRVWVDRGCNATFEIIRYY